MLSVVLPLFNEEENIPRIEAELIPELEKTNGPWEIVTVDDGSLDKTGALLFKLVQSHPNIRVFTHEKNRGLGAAVRTGVSASRGEWVVTMDGDFTFHPRWIHTLLKKQDETKADCVVGSPLKEKDGLVNLPKHRVFLTRASNAMYRRILGCPVTSITAIFRLYRGNLLRELPLQTEGFPINAEILSKLLNKGAKIAEVSVPLTDRTLGTSKAGLVQESLRHITLMAKLVWAKWRGQ